MCYGLWNVGVLLSGTGGFAYIWTPSHAQLELLSVFPYMNIKNAET